MPKTTKKIPWKKILIGELNWKRPFKLIGFVYLTLLVIALFFSSYFLFPSPPASYSKTLQGLDFIAAKDGTQLATRFWRSPTEKALVVYFHGNAVDIGMLRPFAEHLNAQGLSVLTMDYRGYGLTEGTPSEQSCYEDAETLLQRANDLGYTTEDIIFWGRSLGGGIATEIAQRHPSKGLILESTFSSAFRTATHIPIFPFDKFHNLSKIKHIHSPCLFLHGNDDKVIPAWHTQKLQENHPGKNKRFLIKGAGHNDLWTKDLSHELIELDKLFF